MNNQYCLIICGGIGSRLWPFSRTQKPKQFIDFMGTGRTLLQMTYDRYSEVFDADHIFFSTHLDYVEMVATQLPQINKDNILIEPAHRGTAAAIALATYRIAAINPNATIIVAPADHLILNENKFFEVIKEAMAFAATHPVLVTLGIKPHRAETRFGYIQISESNGEPPFYPVKTFTEKPSQELAEVFIESGEFFWNAGIFIWQTDVIKKALQEFLPDITTILDKNIDKINSPQEFEFVARHYESCLNVSIDLSVLEKAPNVYVLCSDFGWSDVGTWCALHEKRDSDDNDNVIINADTQLYNCHNNLIATDPNTLVVLHEINDSLITQSNGVIVICKKENDQLMRKFFTDARMGKNNKYI